MTTVALLVLGLAGGGALGVVFFGGLWWTAQRLATTARPAAVVAASLLLRLGVLAVALVALARADVLLLVGALAGLVGTRIVMTRAAIRGGLPERIASATEDGR